MMFPLAKWVLLNGLKRQTIQRMATRQTHMKHSPNFHDKYGNTVLAGGAIFCVVTWLFLTTKMGIAWNPSPVGHVTPKEWKNK
ncbi:cytochrome c oxidase subunit 7B, mitochondrial [Fukomys damarensis]|uniref:cytochrome c oxidase subunit 7B, mitochondrial n=1 Tax=Fukomys damarensis TaxID=885580 RepID=UPI0005400821|nr:cytochrome c oxidase subunit 7B, mitochondrial [Fukomys damarensis]XP_010638483.1 cytochrome c oxidase subunit 7B, mitochondrial [Fukomys damarensis]XP_010638484.1 cytochrome c oxidase subunit 7B, mitochondrial [Fukomys damarensis]XP_010638485.1 cytochrome c oxidase subunit 7B, mitochondrial [Fukomys damarensis]XP_010638486.1 cytochrome c oxidase subunit 7B, mitochondrial [Fukomys damarensis]XP_010638487.1 cytochrome c oxidase subunit 7B, mitochondrial [Fukomys damarensis]XP_010638488.1 cy